MNEHRAALSAISVARSPTVGTALFDPYLHHVEPVDALGAIARCRKVVVVGDERQLPPTRFFAKITGGGPEDDGAPRRVLAGLKESQTGG